VVCGRASWLKAILLTEPQKAYVGVLALSLALAFGRATEGAVGKGLLSEETVEYARLVAQASVVANALSLPAVVVTLFRSTPPPSAPEGGVLAAWVAKAVLCGPLALLQARNSRPPREA
jgi:hypothetical protein